MKNVSNRAILHPNNTHRVEWVDLAKGICILFVVMMHSVQGVEAQMGQAGWMSAIVDFAQPFRIPAFFVIAGLFLSKTINQPWPQFVDRKIVHFAYFYVLWLTIQYVFKGPGLAAEHGFAAAIEAYLTGFVEPFGTLWFIYLLPIFFVVARLMKNLPMMLVFAGAALLEIAPIHTPSLVINEFAARFVYFYAGYVFAAHFFTIAEWARNHVLMAVAGIVTFLMVNGALVAMPLHFAFLPEAKSHIAGVANVYKAAHFPIVSLVLGFAGTAAMIALTGLMAGKAMFKPLEWAGSHSIVIYLAFFLPMAIARTILIKVGIIGDVGTISLLTWIAAFTGPIIGYAIIQKIGFGRFLFERPNWVKWPVKPADTKIAPAE